MKRRCYLMTGGGSGGHLTPVISVAYALKEVDPQARIVYIGQTGDKLGDIMHESLVFDEIYTVRAGKLRRYHGEGLRQLADVPTIAKNFRDVVYTVFGIIQSLYRIRRIHPDVVFCKGGFVGVPVGLAAAFWRVPYVTHDSDVLPGLANRLIARWARVHAVAMPKELYRYRQDKTVTVGVPIQKQFVRTTDALRAKARKSLGIAHDAHVLLVIGGGLGAQRVNEAVLKTAPRLFAAVEELSILHVAGRGSEESVRHAYAKMLPDNEGTRVRVYGFTHEVATLAHAADLVVTRAGATNMAEFAALGSACIIVPNPLLTGGHQLKNAVAYEEAEAAIVLQERQLSKLGDTIIDTFARPELRSRMSEQLHRFAVPDAASALAHVLRAEAERKRS